MAGTDPKPDNQSGIDSPLAAGTSVSSGIEFCSGRGNQSGVLSAGAGFSVPLKPGLLSAGLPDRPESHSEIFSPPGAAAGGSSSAVPPGCRFFSQSGRSPCGVGSADLSNEGSSVVGSMAVSDGCEVDSVLSLPRRFIQSSLPNSEAGSPSAAGASVDPEVLSPRKSASQSGTASSSEPALPSPESQSGKSLEESGLGVAWEAVGRSLSEDGSARDSPSAGRFPSRKERSQVGNARSSSAVFLLVGASPGWMGPSPVNFTFSNSEVFLLIGSSPGLRA